MKAVLPIACLLATTAPAYAQTVPEIVARGQQVYVQSCTGYCHAPNGAAGGSAPRLAARGFDQAFINEVVSLGIAGTAMRGFASSLPRADVDAVVMYLATLNGIANPTTPTSAGNSLPERALSPDALRGKDLFSDATRGLGRCSTCHEVAGLGIPVAGPMQRIPDSVSALRTVTTPLVSTVTMKKDTMPALVISKGARGVIFYDLTVPPPVLITAEPSSVSIADGSSWRHASVITSYRDGELESILRFLRDSK